MINAFGIEHVSKKFGPNLAYKVRDGYARGQAAKGIKSEIRAAKALNANEGGWDRNISDSKEFLKEVRVQNKKQPKITRATAHLTEHSGKYTAAGVGAGAGATGYEVAQRKKKSKVKKSMADALAYEAWQNLSIDERAQLLKDAKKHKRANSWRKARLAMMGGPYSMALLGLKTGYSGNYVPIGKAEHKPLPKKEVTRLKSKQKNYTQTSAVLGLSSAGLVGAGFAGKKVLSIKALKDTDGAAKLAHNSNNLINTGYGVGTAGAGVSGFGNLNNARIQRNELEKERLRKAFDPEKSRERRQKAYTVGLGAAGAGVLATPTKHLGERVGTGIYNERKAGHDTRVQAAKDIKTADETARDVYAQEAKRRTKQHIETTKKGKKKKIRVNYFDTPEDRINAQNKAASAASKATESGRRLRSLRAKAPQLSRYKTGGKIGQFTTGAALIGLAAGNEKHRRNSGKSYAGYGGGYTN